MGAIGFIGFIATFSGCGPSEASRVKNTGDIRTMMNGLFMAAENPDFVDYLFVEGAAPDSDWFESIKGKLVETNDVTLDGNEAIVTFTVETKTGAVEGKYEWKFAHQDERWFISEAPVSTP